VLNGITEFFGGIAVGVGLLSRLAAVGLFFDMVVAMVTVSFRNGVVSGPGGSGYEINVALAGLALVVVLLGAGRLSVDAWIGKVLTKRASLPVEPHPAKSP
jgi:putative oxidoreductase